MANRSNPTAGQPNAAPLDAHVGNTPKRMQGAAMPHPSTTAAQRNAGGRGHAVSPGVPPVQAVQAHSDIGKPTPIPAVTYGAHGPTYSRPGDMSVGACHAPERGDALLGEALCNTLQPGAKHHSTTGGKGC